MADPAPPKGKIGKKLPKWAIPAGAVGIVLAVLILKKKQAANAGATEPGTEGLSNQSFIPVTGENVAGVGAGLSSGGGESGGADNTAFLTEILKMNKEESAERAQREREYWEHQRESLGTGGGAPSSPAPEGGIAVPTPMTQPPSPAPPPPKAPGKPTPAPARCGQGSHKDFPNGTPPDCWRVSRTKSGNGCECHGHENGRLVCQGGYAHPKRGQSACHW